MLFSFSFKFVKIIKLPGVNSSFEDKEKRQFCGERMVYFLIKNRAAAWLCNILKVIVLFKSFSLCFLALN